MFPALSPQHCQNLKELHFAGPNGSGTICLLSSARFHSQQSEGVLQAMNPACTWGGGGYIALMIGKWPWFVVVAGTPVSKWV